MPALSGHCVTTPERSILRRGRSPFPRSCFTNTGTILADEGVSSITGQTNFANSHDCLQDGATGDVLTTTRPLSARAGRTCWSTLTTPSPIGADPGGQRIAQVTDQLHWRRPDRRRWRPGCRHHGDHRNAFILDRSAAIQPLVDYNLVCRYGTDYFLTSTPNPEAFDPVAISNLPARSGTKR